MGLTLPKTEQPSPIDWTRVRTWWICPTFAGLDLDDNSPVAVRSTAEGMIRDQFDAQIRQCRELGADYVWIGDVARDGVDWLDSREWYPVHAQFSGELPAQVERPYRLSPLTTYSGHVDAVTIFDRALEALAAGDLETGFDLYEHRWGIPQGIQQRILMEMPYWDGTITDGLKLIIHAEQGAGDTLQFARFLKDVPETIQADLLLPRESIRLFQRSFPDWRGEITHGLVKEYDAHMPICSLPRALKLDYRKEYGPYIKSHWYKRLEFAARCATVARPRVGIVWSGSPTHLQNRYRCLTLEDVVKACPPGATLYSLQKGAGAAQLEYLPDDVQVIDWTDELRDWADTAALVDNLDLVVTIDTGVAHLAGAMGKPVKLLTYYPGEWRWTCKVKWYRDVQILHPANNPAECREQKSAPPAEPASALI